MDQCTAVQLVLMEREREIPQIGSSVSSVSSHQSDLINFGGEEGHTATAHSETNSEYIWGSKTSSAVFKS